MTIADSGPIFQDAVVICHCISLWGLLLMAHPSLQCPCIQLHSDAGVSQHVHHV